MKRFFQYVIEAEKQEWLMMKKSSATPVDDFGRTIDVPKIPRKMLTFKDLPLASQTKKPEKDPAMQDLIQSPPGTEGRAELNLRRIPGSNNMVSGLARKPIPRMEPEQQKKDAPDFETDTGDLMKRMDINIKTGRSRAPGPKT